MTEYSHQCVGILVRGKSNTAAWCKMAGKPAELVRLPCQCFRPRKFSHVCYDEINEVVDCNKGVYLRIPEIMPDIMQYCV